MKNFLNFIQQRGLKIDTVFDIGACKGDWSKDVKGSLPNATFFLFEANPAYKQVLADTGFKSFCGSVLSNPERSSVEFFNGTNSGDSYYKETTKFYDSQSTITLPCTTLDSVIQDNNLPIPQLIKLDTQGSELDVLAGFSSIAEVDLVYIECPIICYNKGAPSMSEYLDYFKSNNFVPISVFELHHFEGILLQVDILFMNHTSKEKFIQPTNIIRPFE